MNEEQRQLMEVYKFQMTDQMQNNQAYDDNSYVLMLGKNDDESHSI